MIQGFQTGSRFFVLSNTSILLLVLLFSTVFLTSFKKEGYLRNDAENISKLNHTIIFDLILNYELTEKNGNNSALIDYLPVAIKDVSSVQMNSNYGGENETTRFQYDKTGNLSEIDYQVDDRYYEYVLSYGNNKVTNISIAGKKKLEFTYRNDTLVTITRQRSGSVFEYEITYVPDKSRANFKLFVTTDGKRRASSSTAYIIWDEDYNISALDFDIYRISDIKHLAKGEWESFTLLRENGKKDRSMAVSI